ncbi:MAG TPA: hypothetical protein V6D47_13055, partial [Oscillatoriaceae cyanobacterium]
MRDAWILDSKLTPPSPPAAWLERGLVKGDLPPVTALVAGPGYGKTLGMLALARRVPGPLVWYSLDLYDGEPATFFHYLVSGVQQHIPQFGHEIKALLVGERLEPKLLWQRFWMAIASYNLPAFALVLDDAHHLLEGGDEILKALGYFMDKLPPRTHVLIGARQKLPFPLVRLASKGFATELGPEKLRFDAEEEVAFMRARAPEGKIPNAWWKQATGLDGWPLGLDLATSVAEDRDLKIDQQGGTERMMAYVAEELFGAQSPENQDFMVKASLLEELTPEACRWVFQALDAAELLKALEDQHLVLRLGSASYRFPTYLREFLQREAARQIPAMAFANWHRRAAAYYQDQGQEELAIPHLLASRDWTGAAVACDLAFPPMRFNGRQATIARWLDQFPAEVADSEPLVQLWRGHAYSRGGNNKEALPYYDRARELFEGREDLAGMFKVMVRQCTLALIQEDMRRFGQLQLKAQAYQAEGKPEDVADLCLTRALVAEQRGDMLLMRECNEAVLTVPIEGNVELAASHCIAHINLYTFNLHKGDLARSGAHIAQAIEIADAWGFYPYHLFASFLQAHLRLYEGDTDAVSAFLRTLPPHWTELLDWHDLGCAYAIVGQYHQQKGEWREAEDALKKSVATFEKAGYKEGTKVPLERILWLTIARKQFARASELLSEAVERRAQSIHDLALTIPHARALHLQGEPESALGMLEEAVPALEGLGADLHLTKALLYVGAARFRQGDKGGAKQAVSRALSLAEARDYHFLPGQDQLLWDEIAPLVRDERIQLPFVEQALSSAAGAEVTLAVPEATPQAGLSVRCLGGFEARLDGVLLDQWPRRKAKLILAALLLYPRGLTLVQLAEALGAQEVTPAALTTLKVDISTLRRTLEPSLGKGETSRFVVTEDDRYVLAPDRLVFSDLRAFDLAIERAEANADADASAEAYTAALEHLRGNLLEDAFFAAHFEPERERY